MEGKSWDEVRGMGIYEKRLCMGWTPRKGPAREIDRSPEKMPPWQKKRPAMTLLKK